MRWWDLNSHIPSARDEHWDGNETVSSGGPQVLDDEVFRPFVRDAELCNSFSVLSAVPYRSRFTLYIESMCLTSLEYAVHKMLRSLAPPL